MPRNCSFYTCQRQLHAYRPRIRLTFELLGILALGGRLKVLTCHGYEELRPNCLANCPDDVLLSSCSAPSHLKRRLHLMFESGVSRLDDSEIGKNCL